MKTLSESLEDLAGRVKVLEDSATSAFEANRARLEQRRDEIDQSFKADVEQFDAAVERAAAEGRKAWQEAKASITRPFEELRARVDQRQFEHELHHAQRVAQGAEEDAAAAVELAAYFLNVAEYAVIDATLARMAADDLAAPAPAGVTS